MPKLQRLAVICLALLLLALAAAGWHYSRPLEAPAAVQERYGKALRQARQGEAGAARVLYQQLARDDLTPSQRASLYALLPHYPSPRALKLARADLHHETARVRQAAIDAVVGMVPPTQLSLILGPLLDDPQPQLRYAAATAMLGLSPDDVGLYFSSLEHVLEEYRQLLAAEHDSDDLAGQVLLARILMHQDAYPQAVAVLTQAHQRDSDDAQIIALQVQALERQGNGDAARQWLGEQLKTYPQSAPLQYQLGLWLVAHKQNEYALLALTRAVELAPDNGDYRYRLAVALHDLDQVEAAQRQLQDLVDRQPQNRKARVLLINYWKETGQLQNVQVLLAQLEQQNPDDPLVQQGL